MTDFKTIKCKECGHTSHYNVKYKMNCEACGVALSDNYDIEIYTVDNMIKKNEDKIISLNNSIEEVKEKRNKVIQESDEIKKELDSLEYKVGVNLLYHLDSEFFVQADIQNL